MWWGSFRTDWRLDKWGKWTELEYKVNMALCHGQWLHWFYSCDVFIVIALLILQRILTVISRAATIRRLLAAQAAFSPGTMCIGSPRTATLSIPTKA
jgi:hypothetical protein